MMEQLKEYKYPPLHLSRNIVGTILSQKAPQTESPQVNRPRGRQITLEGNLNAAAESPYVSRLRSKNNSIH